jgi:dTDP-glucose 4,6-dehydratase
MDIRITRTCNNYGPFQQREKFIPNSIISLLTGNKISVYGNGSQEREWLHVSDNCRAINLVLEKGTANQIYNIGSEFHLKNIDLANLLINISKREDECIEFVTDRPGHDQRYSVNSSKIREELGWRPEINFEDGIVQTFEWYKNRQRNLK